MIQNCQAENGIFMSSLLHPKQTRKFISNVDLLSLLNRYAGTGFPAIRDALAAGDYTEAQFVTDRISLIIDGASKYLKGFLWQ